MRFTWSFYLVQQLHEQSTLHSLSIPRDRLFLDARPVPQLHDKQIGSMPYCDNVRVLGKDGDAVERGRTRACQDLRDMGFSIHEEQPATTHMQTLGGIVDGELGLVHLSSERMWNLILAFEYVGRTNKHFSSDSIQRLLSHAMFLCVLCRPGMSIFRSLYDFAGKGLPKCRVWDSARRECCIFSDIIPMLVGNLRRPWSTRVTCSDASPSGYGIVERELPTETVRALGRWNERWRFKRLPVSEWHPRDRALGLSSIFDIETAKRPGLILEQSHEYMEDESSEEVPYGIMDPGAWQTAKIGLWIDTSEHITLKEGRAFVLSLRRLSRDKNQRGRRCCMLVDNLALAMCISKGRAHNYHMLRVCQQYSAIALATDMHVRVRWVPSEVNPADGPSRGSLLPSSSWEEAAGLCGEEGVEEWPLGGDSSPEPECEAQANCESGDIWANSGIIDHLQGTPRASPGISLQEGSEAVQSAEDSASAGPQDQCVGETAAIRYPRRRLHGRRSRPTNVSFGEEKRRSGAAQTIPEVPQFIQGLLQGVRVDMATRRVRLDPCRLLRRHVLGRELACDGARNPGRSGACLHREEGEPGEVKEGPAGMAEANATTPARGWTCWDNMFSLQ